jgi:hypothetical protein
MSAYCIHSLQSRREAVRICNIKRYGHGRKIAKSDYLLRHVRLSVRLSVCMEQLDSHWTDVHEIRYLGIFRKHVEKIQVWLEYDKNNGQYSSIPIYLWQYLAEFLRW